MTLNQLKSRTVKNIMLRSATPANDILNRPHKGQRQRHSMLSGMRGRHRTRSRRRKQKNEIT